MKTLTMEQMEQVNGNGRWVCSLGLGLASAPWSIGASMAVAGPKGALLGFAIGFGFQALGEAIC